MADAEDRGGLWATPLDEQRRLDAEAERRAEAARQAADRRAEDARRAAERRDEERRRAAADAPAPPVTVAAPATADPRSLRRSLFFAVAPAAAVALALSMADAGAGADLESRPLPSGWRDIRMTCDTTRFEGEAGRRLELFRCRALGGGTLPVGIYRSPEVNWDSDIDGRRARAARVVITPSGVLTGWARY